MEDKEKLQKMSEILGMPVANSDSRRRELLDHRNLLIDADRESARSFDKAMITLPAGALALTITFIKEISPFPTNTWLLYIVWGSFILSLLSILISFLTSQSAIKTDIEKLDDELRDIADELRDNTNDKKNYADCWTNLLNMFSIGSFIVGVSFLVVFAIINLPLGD